MSTDQHQSDRDHLAWLNMAEMDSVSGKNILDLGCGSGHLCEVFAAKGAGKVYGIDIVKPSSAGGTWEFRDADLEAKDWQASLDQVQFDLIFAFDIIEHLTSPVSFLKSCFDALNPGGQLILTTPNVNSWERLLRPQSWSGVRDPQHKILFTPYSLRFLLEKSGFKVKSLQAPIRSLSFLGGLQPLIGGQVFSLSFKEVS